MWKLYGSAKKKKHKKTNHKIKPNTGTSRETLDYFYFLLKGRAVKARETLTLANIAPFSWGKPQESETSTKL